MALTKEDRIKTVFGGGGHVNLQQKVGQLIARFKRLQFGYTFPFQIR